MPASKSGSRRGWPKSPARCRQRAQPVGTIERRVGRLLGQNTRAAGMFDIQIQADANGAAQIAWQKVEKWRAWAQLSEGSYVLRTNVTGWSDEDLWRAYIQLTDAETAFRIQKSDLIVASGVASKGRPRAGPHLGLLPGLRVVEVPGSTLPAGGPGGRTAARAGRIERVRAVDVVLSTTEGQEIRTRCVTQPSDHQKILLDRLGWRLPGRVAKQEL